MIKLTKVTIDFNYGADNISKWRVVKEKDVYIRSESIFKLESIKYGDVCATSVSIQDSRCSLDVLESPEMILDRMDT